MINAQEFFTQSLHDSETITNLLAYTEDAEGNHLPNIFEYPCEEELRDNPGKPYIVVQNVGTRQRQTTKDDSFDPMNDITTIEVSAVASTKEGVKVVALAARQAMAQAMDDFSDSDADFYGFCLDNSSYSDSGVRFNVEDGNYFVVMTYNIETYKY